MENIELSLKVSKSLRVYNDFTLKFYDVLVHGFSNKYAWKCPTVTLLNHYKNHLSGNHLEVGVGTGFLIDMAEFPTPFPKITLMDLNESCLKQASLRIQRYSPVTRKQNILEPIESNNDKFSSIGINYVLHCVPGSFKEKGIAFRHLKALLSEEGVLFGSTLLSQGVERNLLSKVLMATYNTAGIFNNDTDSLMELELALKSCFKNVKIDVVGSVALFSATDKDV